MRPDPTPQLLLDLSELLKHDARSGIQRVVRSVLHALDTQAPADYRVVPVYDAGGYYAVAGEHCAGAATDPASDVPLRVRAGDIFLGLDLCPDQIPGNAAVLADLRRHGVRLYFMVYDLIPLLRPDWFDPGMDLWFGRWLDTVTGLADGLICISKAVADQLLQRLELAPPRRPGPLTVDYVHLGADIQASRPSAGVGAEESAVLAQLARRPTLLMVGTLEPRKAHAEALDGIEQLWRRGVDVGLVIVGKPGWQTAALAERLRAHTEFGRRLFWLEHASDEALQALYQGSAVLLAASQAEGFGLPLIEAAQHGLPVIARDIAVFREVGGEHAYYFDAAAGADDGAMLADALQSWLALHARGAAPASTAMPYLSWSAATRQILAALLDGHQPRLAPVLLP